MVNSKKGSFSFTDFLMPFFFDFPDLDLGESILLKSKRVPEKRNKEFYILIGGKVIKMRVEMEKVEGFGESASLKCFVLETDGLAVLPEVSKELSEEINIGGSAQIGQEEGTEVMKKTLGNFHLAGPVRFISDEFAQGQIKINTLRKRIHENKQRRER